MLGLCFIVNDLVIFRWHLLLLNIYGGLRNYTKKKGEDPFSNEGIRSRGSVGSVRRR